jgi:plasmanylethanolamine desaturase
LVLPPLGLALAAGGPTAAMPLAVVLQAALCSLAAGTLLTNLFHKWAHLPAPPPAIAWLQRRRLILCPTAHDQHHQTHTRAYCVTTGWLNRPLDRIDVFGRWVA